MPQPTKPHAARLRKGRYCEPGRSYLLTSVLHERQRLFSDFAVGRLVVNQLRMLQEQGRVQSLAWVVMPDHLHWLVTLRQGSLDSLMHCLKGRSAHSINRHLDRTGPVWQRGYHDHALREEDGLKDLARYVVANPLRAKLVKNIGDYPLWDAVWI